MMEMEKYLPLKQFLQLDRSEFPQSSELWLFPRTNLALLDHSIRVLTRAYLEMRDSGRRPSEALSRLMRMMQPAANCAEGVDELTTTMVVEDARDERKPEG